MWLQNRREATVERTRTTSSVRRDDPGEFRVGRLKHERVKVPRGESLMEWAENVMQIHADRKSVLEVTEPASLFWLDRIKEEFLSPFSKGLLWQSIFHKRMSAHLRGQDLVI